MASPSALSPALGAGLALSPAMLAAGALAAARAVPLAWGLPTFEPGGLAATLRLFLALLFASAAWPLTLEASGPWVAEGMSPSLFAALLLRESTLGLALGFLASRGVRAAEAAGGWIARWSRSDDLGAEELDESGWRFLFGSLAVVIFLRLGGLAIVTRAFLQSYGAWPVVTPAAWVSARSVTELMAPVLMASVRVLESAFGLAAPVLVASWMAELTWAVTFRIFAWSGAREVSQTARALLPVGMVLLGLGALLSAVEAGITEGFWSALRAFTAR